MVVNHWPWQGAGQDQLYAQIKAPAERWRPRRI